MKFKLNINKTIVRRMEEKVKLFQIQKNPMFLCRTISQKLKIQL